jgi:hypothetical protein
VRIRLSDARGLASAGPGVVWRGGATAAVLALVAGAPAVGSAAAPSGDGAAVKAAVGYTPCGTVTVHRRARRVFTHGLRCTSARSNARFVLTYRRSPAGWRCQLRYVRQGTGACSQGGAIFRFVPRT